MSYTKRMDYKAQEIAKESIEDIYKYCDWALDSDDFQNLEGNEYNDAHSYLMSLVARHIANKLLIEKL